MFTKKEENRRDQTRFPVSKPTLKGPRLGGGSSDQLLQKISEILQDTDEADQKTEQATPESGFPHIARTGRDPLIDPAYPATKEGLAWQCRESFFVVLEKLKPEVLDSLRPLLPEFNAVKKKMGSKWNPSCLYCSRFTTKSESISLPGALDRGDFVEWPPKAHAALRHLKKGLSEWSHGYNLTATSESPPWVFECALHNLYRWNDAHRGWHTPNVWLVQRYWEHAEQRVFTHPAFDPQIQEAGQYLEAQLMEFRKHLRRETTKQFTIAWA